MNLREYHERTKHSPESVRAGPHFLDWANQPLPFKIYETLEPQPLPRAVEPSKVSALDALARVSGKGRDVPDQALLARLLHYSAGIVRKKVYPGGHTYYFRAAACTGALYHIDVYLVCGDLPGLSAGAYHFGPHNFSLVRLREGDWRGVLAEASGDEPHVAQAPATLVLASTFWRNAWKYRARAYRHAFWDGGTILANLLAVAAAHDLPAQVVAGFADRAVNELLGLDGEREAAIALVPLGKGGRVPPPPGEVPWLRLPTRKLSAREVTYPEIPAAHHASSLATGADARRWREKVRPRPEPAGDAQRLPAAAFPPTDAIESVILRRGSTRRFSHKPLPLSALAAALDAAIRPLPADFVPGSMTRGTGLTDLYLIVNAVEDLPAGKYFYHARERGLEELGRGDFREQAGLLALGQELGADAAVDAWFLADLREIFGRLGDRGYRAAQLEGGIYGGRLYLAAYALGFGATGLTFFDDLTVEFFSPHAAGKDVMFLTALGYPARRRR